MKVLLSVLLFAVAGFAADTDKPACRADNRGQFWPAQANSDKEVARQFYQSGELEVCSVAGWRYKWEHISVNVHDLVAKHNASHRAHSKRDTGTVSVAER